MRFSQASLGDYHDNCLYFIAGVARNCSLPVNLTQLKSAIPPKFASKSRAIMILGRHARSRMEGVLSLFGTHRTGERS